MHQLLVFDEGDVNLLGGRGGITDIIKRNTKAKQTNSMV
jgi:hypothetical protein